MVFACYQSQLSMREMRDQGYLSTDSGACPVRPSLPQACSAYGTARQMHVPSVMRTLLSLLIFTTHGHARQMHPPVAEHVLVTGMAFLELF